MFFLFRWIKKLGDAFGKLENGAEKVWNHTNEKVQDYLKASSALVKVLNENPQATPEVLFEEIKKLHPEFNDESKVTGLITEAWKTIFAAGETNPDAPDWQTMLTALQNFLVAQKGTNGTKWAFWSETIANSVALILVPEGTLWNKIGTIMWYVYQRFVK